MMVPTVITQKLQDGIEAAGYFGTLEYKPSVDEMTYCPTLRVYYNDGSTSHPLTCRWNIEALQDAECLGMLQDVEDELSRCMAFEIISELELRGFERSQIIGKPAR